eukprot:CAMPEP_0201559246 /NCGR_PEP_ID=MMETSP0173_2-20130828/72737_1 /ASSEMBLY_ACC=CAM_ASM_000268 /TAXON_ID=218659 /ORGANISM="Vexillifera sp., Strain DIVA3 564/2" /LENGTH=102 /DNA_ID=CAMNT_0047973121 /DNA_START=248 /DNA_END=553 /DNA_ORIENTATION=+
MAIEFLAELEREFSLQHGPYVATATRPYAFVKFDIFMTKTKKLFVDTRSQRDLTKVSADLQEAQTIMTESLKSMLARGENIDSVSKKTSALLINSDRFHKLA